MSNAGRAIVVGASLVLFAWAAWADPPARPSPAASPPAAVPNTAILQVVNDAKLSDTGVKGGVSPAILRAEVMLDRLHVSPGVIDGRSGNNFKHALESFEKMRHLKVARGLDRTVWDVLTQDSPKPVLTTYTTSNDDVAGPYFPDLPKDYAKLAEMKRLGYRNPAQKLGAKFHMGEELLGALNPGVDLGKAGQTLVVADPTPEPFHEKVSHVVVDKHTGQVIGYDRRGRIVIAVPATIGSRALPSPSGTYKVKGIAHHPKYYYDPKNFLQGDNHGKLTLPPGPNNPVGSVFIALTKPTYGLHGTPDPSEISKTASHGCVRMTNWDAEELSKLVRRGVVVHFRR